MHGNADLIHKVEFSLHTSFSPQKFVKFAPPFETRQQSYGGFVATISVRLADGTRHDFEHELALRSGGSQRTVDLVVGAARPLAFTPLVPRAWGIELELTTLQHCSLDEVCAVLGSALQKEVSIVRSSSRTDEWRLVPDSSVACSRDDPQCSTFEVVSPKLSGGSGLQAVHRAITALNDRLRCSVSANDSTGFHVHVEVSPLSLAQLQGICCAWLKYEDAFDLLVDPSRRGDSNRYCLSNRRSEHLGNLTNKAARDAVLGCPSKQHVIELLNPRGSRYFKLNLQNLATGRQPTVEFRMHHGTSEYARIGAWVRLLVLFVDQAISVAEAGRQPASFAPHTGPDEQLQRLFQWVVKDRALRDYWTAVAGRPSSARPVKRQRACACRSGLASGEGDECCQACAH